MEKLDRYDRILLTTLQKNGRASNVELSEQASLSAPQCYRRVRRLEIAIVFQIKRRRGLRQRDHGPQ